MPEWKVAELKEIKRLAALLIHKGYSKEELQAESKRQCGVSSFEHLQHCIDTPLKRLKESFIKLLKESST
jgi:hypothetical protein